MGGVWAATPSFRWGCRYLLTRPIGACVSVCTCTHNMNHRGDRRITQFRRERERPHHAAGKIVEKSRQLRPRPVVSQNSLTALNVIISGKEDDFLTRQQSHRPPNENTAALARLTESTFPFLSLQQPKGEVRDWQFVGKIESWNIQRDYHWTHRFLNSWNSFQLAKKLGRKLFNCRTLGHVSPWTESFLQKISAAPFVTWCPTRSQRTLTHKWFDPWRRVIAPRFQILLFSWAYRMMIYGFVFQGIGSRPNM